MVLYIILMKSTVCRESKWQGDGTEEAVCVCLKGWSDLWVRTQWCAQLLEGKGDRGIAGEINVETISKTSLPYSQTS